MRFPSVFLATASLLSLSLGVHSYVIDKDSCKDNYNMVKDMVDGAFIFANNAWARVQRDPMDADTTMYLKELFKAGGTEAKDLILGLLNEQTSGAVTKGLFSITEEKTIGRNEYNNLPRHEVVIFCGDERLKRFSKESKEDNPLKLWDSVAGYGVGLTNGCSRAFAWTHTVQQGAPRYDIIHICDWFLSYAATKKYKTIKDLSSFRASFAVAGLDKLLTKAIYTPIDLASLWDKVMYHELFHTTAGGRLDDVSGFGGYGWKNCKEMSADDARKNADCHAIFGSAAFWQGQGSPIDSDGKFVTGKPNPARRWLGSVAGQAREALNSMPWPWP